MASTPGKPARTTTGTDSPVRFRVRRILWFSVLCHAGGALTVVVNIAVPLGLVASAVRGLVEHSVGEFVWGLVMVLVLAFPCYFFARVGVGIFRAGHAGLTITVGPDGLSQNEGPTLPWDRVQTAVLSGRGRRAALVVRAIPVTAAQTVVSNKGSFQWCRIRLDRMGTSRDEFGSVLNRWSPETVKGADSAS